MKHSGSTALALWSLLLKLSISIKHRHLNNSDMSCCTLLCCTVLMVRWMRWEGVERRKFSWKELWSMEAFHTSFILRATYDVLPSPSNLQQWYGEDPTCPLCPSPLNLKHILVGCKTGLTQGRYTWRHNQVLKCLAAMLETRRTTINALPPSSRPRSARGFVCEGAT